MYNDEKYFDTGKLMDEVLKTEPKFILSDKFADVLVKKISRKFVLANYFKEFMIYIGVIAGLLTVPVAIKLVWFEGNWQEWWQILITNIPLASGIIILLVFILFIDRVVLRYFFYKKSVELN